MCINSNVNLANKHCFSFNNFAPCAAPSIPGRKYDQEPSAKLTEYFVNRFLGLTN